MAIITWNDNLSVGVKSIDLQHQELIRMINDLHDAMKTGKAKNVLGEIIGGLLIYTKTHFSTEERLLQQHDYTQLPQHKIEHEKFVREISDFKKDFDEGRLGLSIKIITFLKDWLLNHIKGTDQQYAAFFKSKGIS